MEIEPAVKGQFGFSTMVRKYAVTDVPPLAPPGEGVEADPPFLVELPGPAVVRYPLASPTLHVDFARAGEAKDFGEAVCAFAGQWGFLSGRFVLFGAGGQPVRGESLSRWRAAVEEVAPAVHLLRRLERGENLELRQLVTVQPPMARATIGGRSLVAMMGPGTVRYLEGRSPIERARVGALALVLAAVNRGMEGHSRIVVTAGGLRGVPTCLLGAVWLRLGMAAVGIKPLEGVSACPRCGELFEPQGRRVYCSDTCRKGAYETRTRRWERRR
ncbi:MAG: hypothetical protein HRF46_06695 [Acidobacteriota bacterium]|jgi:hypothetical protein